jgi:hypothetical protein
VTHIQSPNNRSKIPSNINIMSASSWNIQPIAMSHLIQEKWITLAVKGNANWSHKIAQYVLKRLRLEFLKCVVFSLSVIRFRDPRLGLYIPKIV